VAAVTGRLSICHLIGPTMAIVTRCDECGALLKCRDAALGKKVKCTRCRGIVEVIPISKTPAGATEDEGAFASNLSAAVASGAREQVFPVTRDRPVAERATGKKSSSTEIIAEEDGLQQTRLGARPGVRVVVFVILLLPIFLFSSLELEMRVLSCITPLLLAGTFRTALIRGDRFRSRLYIGFIPVSRHECNLRGVASVNVKYGWDGPGIGTFLVFGVGQVIIGWVLDFLMPSIGGPFQIELATAKGREMMAWQGHSEKHFRSTLDLLTRLTNAEVKSV
jgi:hypothetical protein